MDPSVSVVNMQQMKRCNLPGGKIIIMMKGVQRTFTSQIPVQTWGLIKNQYLWSERLSLIQQQAPAIVRKEREVSGRDVDGGSKVWESFNGKRSLRRETWWKTRSTSILHNRSNSNTYLSILVHDHIIQVCKKYTKKCMHSRKNSQLAKITRFLC